MKQLRSAGYAFVLGLLTMAAVPLSSATSPPLSGRFERLRSQDLRVATVAYRLSVANAARCRSVLASQLGFVTHSIEQYEQGDRKGAARSFGLGRNISVMAVVASSPAHKAGLAPGDELLSVNGQPLSTVRPIGTSSRVAVARAQGLVIEAMKHGPVTLRVSGATGARDVRFTAELGCPANVELIPGDAVNAWADGSRVMISEGLLRLCAGDGDLALVLGHEMAHNLLHHRQRLAAHRIAANGLLPLTAAGSREMRETEEEADQLAVELATTAAYDLSGAETFLSGLLGKAAPFSGTHPSPGRRVALMRNYLREAQRVEARASPPQGLVTPAGAGPLIAKTSSIPLTSGRM